MTAPTLRLAPTGRVPHGLGLDAGGTQTRWALADAAGAIVAEGAVAGFNALQMENAPGRAAIDVALKDLARQVLAIGRPATVNAGLTGFGGDGARMRGVLAAALQIPVEAVAVSNDLEIAYRDVFAPGEGYLVYAGTGSIAAFIDAGGELHRAGGRGVVLDDGGGGFWIAREALRHVWRAEDQRPGSWHDSLMAREIFAHIGGSDWAATRQFVYAGERGQIGKLALAVAAVADIDPVAHAILRDAGRELARLGTAMTDRFGARPYVLSGRVVGLHPVIETSFRALLPANASVQVRVSTAHFAAARIAVKMLAQASADWTSTHEIENKMRPEKY